MVFNITQVLIYCVLNLKELISFMDYVEKLVTSTTETSFLAGAETVCTTLSERLHAAQIMVKYKFYVRYIFVLTVVVFKIIHEHMNFN